MVVCGIRSWEAPRLFVAVSLEYAEGRAGNGACPGLDCYEIFPVRLSFLKKLAHARPEKETEILVYAERLEAGKEKLMTADRYNWRNNEGTIMGLEGAGGRTYFEALSYIMPDRYKFSGALAATGQRSIQLPVELCLWCALLHGGESLFDCRA